MTEQPRKCIIEECDRDAYHRESGLCKRCYAFLYYWQNRSPTDKAKRYQRLKYWEKRARALLLM